jgi:hypothetical protein
MTKAREVDWEVLPPEQEKRRANVEPLFKWLALIMDQALRLPGTKFRFGLDPLIGLIPGLGDTASAIVSGLSLIYAARCGIPKRVLGQMSVNILLNELIGIVPGVGDAFSFWFKSNVRNYELLRQHLGAPVQPRKRDWLFVGVILVLLLVVVCAGLLVSYLVLRALLKL